MDITHQDLTTTNIVITPKGSVKILELGLASWTRSGRSHGSQDDLFSLGAVMFEMITGKPFDPHVSVPARPTSVGREVPHSSIRSSHACSRQRERPATNRRNRGRRASGVGRGAGPAAPTPATAVVAQTTPAQFRVEMADRARGSCCRGRDYLDRDASIKAADKLGKCSAGFKARVHSVTVLAEVDEFSARAPESAAGVL